MEESAMNKSMLIVAALAMPAFFSTAPTVGAEDMKSMNMMTKPATSPADKAFATAMKTMMNNMQVKPTGKPDADFALMMIPHHQGAIDMAKVELQYGTDPELRQLATDIVAAQEKEIAQMKAWLEKNGK
jgi:uncharacterized protein (DUF305 family)